MIDLYQYIASNNPRAAKEIMTDFGYRQIKPDIAQNLREFVNMEGESAVVALMKYHPDSEYFEEYFSKNYGKKIKKKSRSSDFKKMMFLNATGNNNNSSKTEISANQTNTIILAAAMLITIAIITNK